MIDRQIKNHDKRSNVYLDTLRPVDPNLTYCIPLVFNIEPIVEAIE